MIFYEYKFITHLFDEYKTLQELGKEYKSIKYTNIRKILNITLKECKTNNKKDNNYTFNINNEIKYIDEDEFWNKWNDNLYKIIEGEYE